MYHDRYPQRVGIVQEGFFCGGAVRGLPKMGAKVLPSEIESIREIRIVRYRVHLQVVIEIIEEQVPVSGTEPVVGGILIFIRIGAECCPWESLFSREPLLEKVRVVPAPCTETASQKYGTSCTALAKL